MRFSLCFRVRRPGGQRDGKKPDNKETGKHLLHSLCLMTGACPCLHKPATESFWTNVHTMEGNQDAAGLLSWSPRALARHLPLLGDGGGWARTVSESKTFLYVAVLLCVCPTFASCVFFASGVILELQAVLGWSIRSAPTHHFQRCHTQVAEDWRGNESPKWTTVLAQCHGRSVPLPHNTNCRLRLNRSRERDLSSDLIVLCLTWGAKSVN